MLSFSKASNASESLPGIERQVIVLATAPISQEKVISDTYTRDKVKSIVACAFNAINYRAIIKEVPWTRARREVINGKMDGIYLTDSKGAAIGVSSHPVYLEKWFAYSLAQNDLIDKHPKIGTIKGSSEETWLQEQGTRSFIHARSIDQLVSQFVAGRFDLFIADRHQTQKSLQQNFKQVSVRESFVRYSPKRLTFSNQFVDQHPHVVEAFNQQIGNCNKEITKLSAFEREKVINFIEHDLLPLFSSNSFRQIQKEFDDHNYTIEEVLSLDKAWRHSVENNLVPDFAETMMELPMSKFVQGVKQKKSFIHEIMITNSEGALVATSDVTSDFWQGDESKILNLQENQFYLSEITYDESSNHFISHYSTRLIEDEKTPEKSLILVVGIALEGLLVDDVALAFQAHKE